jgi:ABC-type amino acid transport substrate-binding protein
MKFASIWAGILAVHVAAAASSASDRLDVLGDIRRSDTLKVCVVFDYSGINFRDPRSGQLTGLDIEMAKALSSSLNVTLRFVETNFYSFIDDLNERRCHIAMMGIWVSSGRASRIAFSEPYLSSAAYVAVARANTRIQSWADVDRPETLVAVIDTPELQSRSSQILPKVRWLPVPAPQSSSSTDTVMEVRSGRADALIVDHSMATSLRRDGWARIITPPTPVPLTEIAYGVVKNDSQWLETVNDFVRAKKRDGSLRATADRFGLSTLFIPQ